MFLGPDLPIFNARGICTFTDPPFAPAPTPVGGASACRKDQFTKGLMAKENIYE